VEGFKTMARMPIQSPEGEVEEEKEEEEGEEEEKEEEEWEGEVKRRATKIRSIV
jgi:hypothetical protein